MNASAARPQNAWETYRHRAAVLRDVITGLEQRPEKNSEQSSGLPWNDVIAEVFTDRADLLVALHDLWSRRLAARLDLALELHDIPEASVAEAYAAVAADLAPVRRVLDAHAHHPALARHRANADRMIALAAGLATVGDPLAVSAARGAAFRARTARVVVPARRDGWLAERLTTPFTSGPFTRAPRLKASA
ncbi:hypothetical protein [Nocardioides cavernaquae]|nr:hypothetical protein [Nocardioides cavernaquae]